MNNQYYLVHRSYENLISRSLKRPTTARDTKRLSAYLNLVTILNGYKFRNDKPEVQFELLKKYLVEAFTKFRKRKLKAVEKAAIADLIEATNDASQIEQIDMVIKRGLEITDRLK